MSGFATEIVPLVCLQNYIEGKRETRRCALLFNFFIVFESVFFCICVQGRMQGAATAANAAPRNGSL